jgi:phosphoglycerate dehydrogenase-like enzyme
VSDPLVWLPFDPSHLEAAVGELPRGLRLEVVDPTQHVPDSVEDVRFYVAPYQMGPAVGDVLPRMSSLEVVQVLSAGVDNVRDRVPDGVLLCNGRGIHDTSTAELTLALVLASLRDVPGMVRDQDARRWNTRWRPALADKRVLLVGYGAIGRAIEQRLLPFETEVARVARTARQEDTGPVHGFDELPDLLPHADVVVLICPLTDETRGLVDAEFLGRMKDGALLVNMARGAVVETDALLAELRSERLIAPGLLISPHVGGASSAMWPRAHRLVAEQLHRYAVGEPLHNQMTGAY